MPSLVTVIISSNLRSTAVTGNYRTIALMSYLGKDLMIVVMEGLGYRHRLKNIDQTMQARFRRSTTQTQHIFALIHYRRGKTKIVCRLSKSIWHHWSGFYVGCVVLKSHGYSWITGSTNEQEIRSMERVSAQCCSMPYTVIEIFDCNCNDRELGRFKVIQSQRSWCQSIAQGWFPIRLPLTPSSYLSPFSKYLTCNFNDLELAAFKVIQGQR